MVQDYEQLFAAVAYAIRPTLRTVWVVGVVSSHAKKVGTRGCGEKKSQLRQVLGRK